MMLHPPGLNRSPITLRDRFGKPASAGFIRRNTAVACGVFHTGGFDLEATIPASPPVVRFARQI